MRVFNTTVIIIIAFLIFVVFHLYRGAYASSDLAGMWYSAFIGSIITYFLLTMQSKGMVERERQAEVFKERLDIYQDFLKKLYDIVEDKKIEDKEILNLQFRLSYLAMHTDCKRMEVIQNHTFEILKTVCVSMSSGENEDIVIMNHLYEIVCQMQAQLYEKEEIKLLNEETPFWIELWNKGISLWKKMWNKLWNKGTSSWEKWKENNNESFKKCFSEGGIQIYPENKNAEQSIKHSLDAETMEKLCSILLSSRNNEKGAEHNVPNKENDETLEKNNWKALLETKYLEWEFLFESQGFQIRKPYGHVGIRYNADSGLYDIFANYWKGGVNQSEFSKPMKWDFGGTRNYGAWGVPLNSKGIGITSPIEASKLYTCLMSDEVKSTLLEKMGLIVDHLEKHNRSVEWMQALKKSGLDEKKWGVGVWYWDNLVCTALQDHPRFGKFRMGVKANDKDIIHKEDKKMELILENTEFDHDKLVKALNHLKTLKKLKIEDHLQKVVEKKEKTLVVKVDIKDINELTNEIAETVKAITDRIEEGV